MSPKARLRTPAELRQLLREDQARFVAAVDEIIAECKDPSCVAFWTAIKDNALSMK